MADLDKELSHREFINREYSVHHAPFEKEFEFYDYVKLGDIENVKRTMTALASEGSGKLSDDELRNLKYHFVITIALITRFCVEGGMEMETAYSLSDIHINAVDKCRDAKSIHKLHYDAVMDYTRRMERINKQTVYSKPVIIVMDFIYDNLHSRITEQEIADHASLSPSYISRLFHKETGVTISTYIAVKRVEAAGNMLRYSELPSSEIGNYLAFSSHSHFISTFRRYTGMTPGEYRKKYFRSSWEMKG